MMKTLVLVFTACALMGLAGPSAAGADDTRGQCNRIIGNALGPAQQFYNGVGDPGAQCQAIGAALFEFLNTPGCFEGFLNGELGLVLASNAPFRGEPSPLGTVICTSILGCGFGPALPPEICAQFR